VGKISSANLRYCGRIRVQIWRKYTAELIPGQAGCELRFEPKNFWIKSSNYNLPTVPYIEMIRIIYFIKLNPQNVRGDFGH
jgi:hypothetical protein